MARRNDSPLFEDVFEKTQPAAPESAEDPEIVTEKAPAAPESAEDPEIEEEEPKIVRATFMIEEEQLDFFKDYCYTRRINQSEGIKKAISLLEDSAKDMDIIRRPKKPKQKRKKRKQQ